MKVIFQHHVCACLSLRAKFYGTRHEDHAVGNHPILIYKMFRKNALELNYIYVSCNVSY
jgi:hypothetical protein